MILDREAVGRNSSWSAALCPDRGSRIDGIKGAKQRPAIEHQA
jgi:hypothetical protein